MQTSQPPSRICSISSVGTSYLCSGTNSKEDITPYCVSIFIIVPQKSRPAFVSTSWVITQQAEYPSGQYQIKGISGRFSPCKRQRNAFSKISSALKSTGQAGKVLSSQPFNAIRCKCLRNATGNSGLSK